jgi:hypothetical protein
VWPAAARFGVGTPLIASAAITSAVAVVYTAHAWDVAQRSMPAQLWCLAATGLWLAVGIRDAWPGWRWRRPDAVALAVTIAVLTAAFLVRHWMLGVLPLPDRSGFEELQMGSDGYRLLTTGQLPLEFRFTKAMAAAGLWWGGPTLSALRLPFQLLGYARLVVTFMVLRLLGVGRAPSGFLTLVVAASRWSVISSGSAYEDFSATAVLLLLIFCLGKLDLERASAGAWAAAAGGLAGVLMFENSSFRFAILLAVGWVAWLALRSPSGVRAHWQPLALFGGALTLVSLPMLVDIAHNRWASIFFEAIIRYREGRAGLLPNEMGASLWRSLKTLAGFPVRIDLCLAPDFGHAVQPVIGLLSVGGALSGLVRAGRPFVRALVLAVLGAVVVCVATTDFFMASRLAPVVTILLLTGGILFQDIGSALRWAVRRVTAGLRPTALGSAALASTVAVVFYAGLAATLVADSVRRVESMAADLNVRNEYLNNQYLTAATIARTARPGSRVIVVTPGQMRDWTDRDIANWLYAGRGLVVTAAPVLPSPEEVSPGTLVVLAAEGRPLDDGEVGQLSALGAATGSAGSVSFLTEPGDRKLVGSVCVRCE